MLTIRLSRKQDGTVILHCRRADGTETWQRQDARRAGFFAFHDLRHYAVETVLGFRRGFFGLVAEGWEIEETDGKHARGPLPPEAAIVEQIVGLLDRERVGGGAPLTAAWVNEHLRAVTAEAGMAAPRSLTDAELDAVRARAEELHERWARVEPGGELELEFL